MIRFNKEQIYIITGASSGLGETTALLLNRLGATVIAIARNEKRLFEMQKKSKYPKNIHIEIKDLTKDINDLPKYVKSLKEKYGKFSGMAYCAGISGAKPLQGIDYNFLKDIFDISYFARIMITKGIADRRNNMGKGTSLVYISSIDAVLSSKGQSGYSGAKSALSSSIKAIAKEISAIGIRANCVLPSMIKTPMTTVDNIISEDDTLNLYPFGWGSPEDAANMIIFLLPDEAKFISGQNYIIDSGGVI